jgi:hypothetical protein
VARLVDAGVLAVVTELRLDATAISPDELATMTADEHRQAFVAFVAGLLGDFDRYLARGDIDFQRDGAGYRLGAFWLDDAEYEEMMAELNQVLLARLPNQPRPAAGAAPIGSVLLPGEEAPPGDDGEDPCRNST